MKLKSQSFEPFSDMVCFSQVGLLAAWRSCRAMLWVMGMPAMAMESSDAVINTRTILDWLDQLSRY